MEQTINYNLLNQTLEFVTKLHETEAIGEKSWNQGTWRCSTGMCFAGWAAELAGRRWVDDTGYTYEEYLVAEEGDDEYEISEQRVARFGPDGNVTHYETVRVIEVGDAARGLLGLSQEQADALFGGTNKIKDLTYWVEHIDDKELF